MSNIFVIVAENENKYQKYQWIAGIGNYNQTLFLSLEEANRALIVVEEEAKEPGRYDKKDKPTFKVHKLVKV